MPAGAGTPRLATLLHQLAAEAFGVRGKVERCLEQLELATNAALLDHEWLELCPALAEARRAPTFREIERRVRARADALWKV